jgi:8-oxo-dGTP diphosphatase
MTKRYVVGLLFDDDRHVLLIKKTHPEWQEGKLNGIGGRVRDDEMPFEAMVREFKEECGLVITDWHCVSTLHGVDANEDNWKVFFYAASCSYNAMLNAEQLTDEMPCIAALEMFYEDSDEYVPNLYWIVPMALQSLKWDTYHMIREG